MLATIRDNSLPLTQADEGLTTSTNVVKPFIFSSLSGPPKWAGKSLALEASGTSLKKQHDEQTGDGLVHGWKRVGMADDSLEGWFRRN
ncbi:hypothetical protein ACOSP7_007494 [Xanthoceras sorbifolium]